MPTKEEVLDMFNELLGNRIDAIEAHPNHNANALFVASCLLLQHSVAENTVPDNALRLPIKRTCGESTIHPILMGEAKTRDVIVVMIGSKYESKSMKEIIGVVRSVANTVRAMRYRRIT